MIVRHLMVVIVAFSTTLYSGAAETSQSKAERLLNEQSRAKSVLSLLHFGATYSSHKCERTGGILDNSNRLIPGAFYLDYEYVWDAGGGLGHTTVRYYFNGNGILYHVGIQKTDAIVHQPFAMANISIAIVGGIVQKALENDLSEQGKADLQKIIQNADAKKLLEFSLAIDLLVSK